jgi:hypothetical protein
MEVYVKFNNGKVGWIPLESILPAGTKPPMPKKKHIPEQILEALELAEKANTPLTKMQLANDTGIKEGTLNVSLLDLYRKGIVKRIPATQNGHLVFQYAMDRSIDKSKVEQ